MTIPTVAERIDPDSPHYDAVFAEARRKAFGAWGAHKADLKDPEYRKAAAKAHRPYKVSK